MTTNEELISDPSLDADASSSRDGEEKKRRMRLLRLLLKSDVKNPRIWAELRKSKESLLENMKGDIVSVSNINEIFWAHASVNEDIYIHKYLRKYLSTYFVQQGGLKISVSEYMSLLRMIKTAFDPIKANFDHWKKLAMKCLQDKDDGDLADGTEIGYENYKAKLWKELDILYKRTYPSTDIQKQEDDLLIELNNGTANLYDIARYLTLQSYFPEGKAHALAFLKPYVGQPILLTDTSISMTIQQALDILSSLNLGWNIFKKL